MLWLTLLWLTALAAANTVTIDTFGDPEARLELRTIRLPDGSERTLYRVRAERVEVRSEGVTITATEIEFDPLEGEVRLIGRGRVEREGETLIGDDLVVNLHSGRADGRSVIALVGSVQVTGEQAQRVEGRIRMLQGAYSPCARCGQETEDFGLRAERIEILPGDRLIAWNATLLIREQPFLELPLLVLPLADEARTPHARIASGREGVPAEVALRWPYAAGPNAFGSVSLRWLADVDPQRGTFPLGPLLGGAPVRHRFAAAIDHRFFDERGAGHLQIGYRQGAAATATLPEAPPVLRFEAVYRSDAAAGDPQVRLRAARDDDRRDRLLELEAEVAASTAGVRFAVSTRLPVPLAPDAQRLPSWHGAHGPEAVPLRLQVGATGALPLELGPFRLESASLDLGAFRAPPDPSHRGVATRASVDAGRAEATHRVTFRAETLFATDVRAVNEFRGRYYAGGERQVAWRSEAVTLTPLADRGSLRIAFNRDVVEGETPFAFDREALRSRSDLSARLQWRPNDQVRLEIVGGTVLRDDRRPNEVGLAPLVSRLDAFLRVPWLDARLEHRADPRFGDWGTLDLDTSLRSFGRGDLSARLRFEGLWDLTPGVPPPDQGRAGASERDRTRATVTAEAAWRERVSLRLQAGVEAEPSDAERGPWTEATATVTLGTFAEGRARPALEATWRFDPNEGESVGLDLRAALDLGPLRLQAQQRLGPEGGRPGESRLSVRYRGVAELAWSGMPLLPGDWFGLAPDPQAPRTVRLQLQDDGAPGGLRFEAEWRTTFVPDGDGDVTRRNSLFTARLRLAERRFAGDRIGAVADVSLDLPLRDDALSVTYLRRARLEVGLDLAGVVGLQGAFGYRGVLDPIEERISSGRLSLQEVVLVVRSDPAWTVGATWDDVFEVAGDAAARAVAPLDLRPTLFVTWDRCCWAAYASWNARSGEIVLTVGAPGVREGPQLRWDSGAVLPPPQGADAVPGAGAWP